MLSWCAWNRMRLSTGCAGLLFVACTNSTCNVAVIQHMCKRCCDAMQCSTVCCVLHIVYVMSAIVFYTAAFADLAIQGFSCTVPTHFECAYCLHCQLHAGINVIVGFRLLCKSTLIVCPAVIWPVPGSHLSRVVFYVMSLQPSFYIFNVSFASMSVYNTCGLSVGCSGPLS